VIRYLLQRLQGVIAPAMCIIRMHTTRYKHLLVLLGKHYRRVARIEINPWIENSNYARISRPGDHRISIAIKSVKI
jgi:hypothetical protein